MRAPLDESNADNGDKFSYHLESKLAGLGGDGRQRFFVFLQAQKEAFKVQKLTGLLPHMDFFFPGAVWWHAVCAFWPEPSSWPLYRELKPVLWRFSPAALRIYTCQA